MPLPREIARRFDAASLEHDPASIAVIGSDGVILWVNSAWDAFARDNGAPAASSDYCVGTRYLDAISGTLRPWFEQRLRECLDSGVPFDLEYECSSADVFRAFYLRALPVGSLVLLTHSLRHARPHTREPKPPIESLYRAPNGLLLQCSNCRRYRQVDGGSWDWVPTWVEHEPPRVSHGICAVCTGFYYGDLLEGAAEASVRR